MEAYAHYEDNSYTDAVADADRFLELYPGNSSAVYAYYLKAQCYFEQILDVGRDQGRDATGAHFRDGKSPAASRTRPTPPTRGSRST